MVLLCWDCLASAPTGLLLAHSYLGPLWPVVCAALLGLRCEPLSPVTLARTEHSQGAVSPVGLRL